jgi:hypothetical protein
MIYIALVLVIIAIVAGFLAYLSIKKNSLLKKDLADTQKLLLEEIELRTRIEEANKAYVQKLASLSKGTDSDKFNAALAIMSNGKAPPAK